MTPRYITTHAVEWAIRQCAALIAAGSFRRICAVSWHEPGVTNITSVPELR